MVETTEDRGGKDAGAFGRAGWGQVFGAVGRLHAEASVRSAVVVGYVVVEKPLGVVLVLDDDVVEAVSSERADHTLAEGVGLGRPRRCGEKSGAEPANAAAKVGAVDRVTVVDEEARNLASVGCGFNDALRGPAGRWDGR
jgi:hypothetical protein